MTNWPGDVIVDGAAGGTDSTDHMKGGAEQYDVVTGSCGEAPCKLLEFLTFC